MFYKWGHFAYRHRRIIPVLVIALIVAMQVLFGSKLGERLSQEGWEDPGADSTAAAESAACVSVAWRSTWPSSTVGSKSAGSTAEAPAPPDPGIGPGDDGDYAHDVPRAEVERWVAAAAYAVSLVLQKPLVASLSAGARKRHTDAFEWNAVLTQYENLLEEHLPA